MTTQADPALPPNRSPRRFDVRSATGAHYTIVEEIGAHGPTYCTAFARLPVEANDDGTFTIVDTRTRLVRVDAPR